MFPIIKNLIEKNVIVVKEQLYEQYKPKLLKYIRLKDEWSEQTKLSELLDNLSRAKKQREVVLTYFQLNATTKKLKVSQLQTASNCSLAVIKSLVDKEVFEYYYIQTDRINYEGNTSKLKELTSHQEIAYNAIKL